MLALTADAALSALKPEQRVIAKRILLRLVQFGEGRLEPSLRETLPNRFAQPQDDKDPPLPDGPVLLGLFDGGSNFEEQRTSIASATDTWPNSVLLSSRRSGGRPLG